MTRSLAYQRKTLKSFTLFQKLQGTRQVTSYVLKKQQRECKFCKVLIILTLLYNKENFHEHSLTNLEILYLHSIIIAI